MKNILIFFRSPYEKILLMKDFNCMTSNNPKLFELIEEHELDSLV